MIEEPSRHSDSQLNYSRIRSRRKDQSKLKQYETNMENYTKNEHFRLEKVDPKGLIADAVYASFSGVIESAELFLHQNEDFQINYQIIVGEEWHDETPDINDMEGISTFCEAKDGKVAFSLSFDCLLSCVYVQSWPQLVIKLKGFNWKGEMITKGYAQLHLPAESGQKVMEAYIYTVVKDLQWYHRFLPFMRPDPIGLDEKDFERIICRGEGRESQKIRSIGKLKIRGETLLRNYDKFGYR